MKKRKNVKHIQPYSTILINQSINQSLIAESDQPTKQTKQKKTSCYLSNIVDSTLDIYTNT